MQKRSSHRCVRRDASSDALVPISLILSGLIADYRFRDGSGTAVSDSSGNGMGGTFGAGGLAPTWSASGLVFAGAQQVTTPLDITQIKTVQIAGNLNSNLTAGFGLIPVLGNSGPGLNWGYQAGKYPWYQNPLACPGVKDNAGWQSTTYDYPVPNAPGITTWTHDGTNDRYWVDGLEADYDARANNAATSRTGSLSIGYSPANPFINHYSGTMHRLLVYSRALSATEVVNNSNVLAADVVSRSVTYPATNPSTLANIAAGIDSLTYGLNATSPSTNSWFSLLVGGRTYATTRTYSTYYNNGIGGMTLATFLAKGLAKVSRLYAPGAPINTFILWGGTNEASGGQTPTFTFNALQTAANSLTSQGWKVVIPPMISRSGYDSFKNSYNAMIAAANFGPNVLKVPVTALPDLVPDGSYSNTTYFDSDQIHLSNTGHAEVAAAVKTQVDLFG